MGWIGLLGIANWLFGAFVIIYGIMRYWSDASIPAGLVALAVFVVGPLEDLLEGMVRRRTSLRPGPAVELVDKTTSVVFLILLLVVIYLIPSG